MVFVTIFVTRPALNSIILVCFLASSLISAAPTCPTMTDNNKVAFCGPNVTNREWVCPICQPGLGSSVQCGRVYSQVLPVDCQECKNGTYSDQYDTSQCKPCASTPCMENEDQIGECKPDHNTLKCKCKPGYYRAHNAYCMPCSWCCEDKTNEHEDECMNLEKQCSYQDVKSCDPPTTEPTTYSTTNSVTSAMGKTSATSEIPSREATTSTTKDPQRTTKGFNDPRTKKDSNDAQIKGDKKPDSNKWDIVKVLLPVLFVALVGIFVYLCWRRSNNSSGGDSSQGSESSLTSNELHSSALLITEDEKSAAHEKREIAQIKSKDTVTYAKGGEGPDGTQPLLANKTVTRLDAEKLCFICERLGQKIEDLDHEVMQTLCDRLNVAIAGKDYQNLDAFCKLGFFPIRHLEKRENPMKDIIGTMVGHGVTLEAFLEELYNISRGDVVQALYDMAKKKKINR